MMTASVLRRTAPLLFSAALATPTVAFADLTPEDVWAQWQTVGTSIGQDISAASEERAGDTLTLTGVRIDMDLPDGTLRSGLDTVALTATGDGRVRMTFPPAYEVTMEMAPAEGPATTTTMRFEFDSVDAVASGTPEDMRYDFDAAALRMTLPQMIADGEAVPMEMSMALTGLDMTYAVSGGEQGRFTSSGTADSMTFDIDGQDPEDPGETFRVTGRYDDVFTTSEGSIAGLAMSADPQALFSGNLDVSGGYRHGGGTFTVAGDGPDGRFDFSSVSGGGSLSFAAGPAGLTYAGESTNVAVEVSADDMPVPSVQAEMSEAGFGLTMPVQQSEEAQPFDLRVSLDGLTVSEGVWALVDPSGLLPRDPATLRLDLGGMARITADLSDPATMDAPVPPAELDSLSLDDLTLSIAGAALTGSGSFTFDHGSFGMFGPMGTPTGGIDLTLAGGPALIDRLVQIGVVPEDQAAMARMMLGMFARPGEAPDTLESRIEIGPDGSITANGQPLQ
ncbi:DUF2125 domain-containing protein [Rhodobacteraceae bacterium CCMM004]|nr:DUF2125 domain-containing protein [Rhodobacteraceae bacterium CCMM004]